MPKKINDPFSRNYIKPNNGKYGIFSSKRLIDNPIITNPSFLIDRKIYSTGEKLVDFLPKMANHLSVRNSFPIEDPSARLFMYSLTENNKIYSLALLAHDKTPKEKSKYCSFAREDLKASWANSTQNLIFFGWEVGTMDILKIAEFIIYMGAPEMCEINKNGEIK